IVDRAMTTSTITYPPELPVSQRRDEIAKAVRDHQVVVVGGETGSGKTTQLPKICLELGRGTAGMIGHTQPRRLAPRTLAERIPPPLGSRTGRPGGGGRRPAPWPSGSPPSSAPSWAAGSATRSASPTGSAATPRSS